MYGFNRVNSARRLLALAASHSSQPNALFSNPSRRRRGAYKGNLPPELSRNTIRLTCDSTAWGGVCHVYVLGTVHDSQESRQQVKSVVNFLKPQVVFLELCCRDHNLDIFESMEYGEPVSEFQVAYEEATRYGAKVILGDRCMAVALERLFDQLYRSCKEGTLSYNVWKYSSEIKEEKEWLSRDFPNIFETMIVERDKYMSARLQEVARKHKSVVAVVGRAHLPGLQIYWNQHVEANQLLSVSSKGRVLKWASYCFSSYMCFMIQKVLV